MEFKTTLNFKKEDFSISYQDPILLIGSCFIEHIGKKLSSLKFSTCVNPTGVVYNPISIQKTIEILLNNRRFTKQDLFFHGGLWNSFSHHSRFSDKDQSICLEKINSEIETSVSFFKTCKFLFLTFGTAFVYELESGEVVSNCHKLPAKTFIKRMLSVDEIYENYKNLIQKIQTLNPEIKIVFTVSPIRHLADGFHQNQLSKSTLLLAIDRICQNSTNTYYFPSYELVLDDLRDYRFYAQDMAHPNELAVAYVWEYFSESYFDKTTKAMIKKVESIIRDLNHKPFNPDSDEYRKFQEQLQRKIDELGFKF